VTKGLLVFQAAPANGTLTQVAGSPFLTAAAHTIVPHPNGKWLFDENGPTGCPDAVTFTCTLQLLSIADTGTPSVVSAQPLDYVSILLEPSGNFLFEGFSHDDAGSVYGIDAISGALTKTGSGTYCDFPMVWTPSGTLAYCITTLDNFILQGQLFSPDASTLTVSGGVDVFPIHILDASEGIDPSGRFVYLAGTDVLPIYLIDPATANLTVEANTTSPGSGIVFSTTAP
jgi:hypothetical protein